MPETVRPREERLCRRAELEFGLSIAEGEVVVERARRALELADEEIAPRVDWREGARRVAAVDRDKLG